MYEDFSADNARELSRLSKKMGSIVFIVKLIRQACLLQRTNIRVKALSDEQIDILTLLGYDLEYDLSGTFIRW